MGDFRVRDFIDSDFENVMHLWESTGMGGSERGDDLAIVNGSLNIGGRLLVMVEEDSDILVGTSWMTFDGRRIHLHHFGILPYYQGRGLSKILLKASLKHVLEKGYQVKIEVHQENSRALNLYRQFGFKNLGDYDVFIIRQPELIKKYL